MGRGADSRSPGPGRAGIIALAVLVAGLLWPSVVATPASRADAQPGDLDTSFGGDGKVTTGLGGGRGANAVAILGNGRIVAAGDAVGAAADHDLGLAAYGPDGARSFDPVRTDLGSSSDAAGALAITPGLGIVVAGSSGADIAVSRYFGFGVLNPGFGGDGIATASLDFLDRANAVALASDGKIVAAGQTCDDYPMDGGDCDFAVVRFNGDGTLDTSFDGDGEAAVAFGAADAARGVAIQPDGKIVLAGHTDVGGGRFALARLLPNGTLDPSFDGDGRLTTQFSAGGDGDGANGVAIQPDGKIDAVGYTAAGTGDFALARYLADGSLDPGFGRGGRQVTDFFSVFGERANAIAIQPDGKIVVGGRTPAGLGNFALARYLPEDGSLDPSFGDAGRVTTGIGGDEALRGLAIQPDGKIVAAGGTTTGGGRFLLARYRAEPYDDTPPETTIESGPPGLGNESLPSFAFSSSEPGPGSFFDCRFGGSDDDYMTCASPFRPASPLPDGTYRFVVRARDGSGNVDPTPATRSFTVDSVPPRLVLGGHRRQRSGRRIVVRARCNEPCAVVVRRRGKARIGARRVVRLRLHAARARLAAGEAQRLRLRFGGKPTQRRVRRALRRGRPIAVRLEGHATDAAGSRSRARFRVRLGGKRHSHA